MTADDRSRILRDHLERPRGEGRIDRPDASARAVNPACGDVLELDLALAGGRIAEARQRVQGCPAARAVASFLVERLAGLTPREAAALDEAALDAAAGGLPRMKRHAATLAADALAAALDQIRHVSDRDA